MISINQRRVLLSPTGGEAREKRGGDFPRGSRIYPFEFTGIVFSVIVTNRRKENGMKCIRRWYPVFFAFLLLAPAPLLAQDNFGVALQANDSAIEFIGDAGFEIPPSKIYATANYLYNEDEYTIFGLQGLVGNAVQFEGLTGKIGFKGFVGDFERPYQDSQLLGIAFSAGAAYDLADVMPPYYVPVILSATLNVGPKPLCFDDTEEYLEAIFAVDWKILENGAITASYRHLDVDFNQPVDWHESDNPVYLGVKFMF